MRLGIGGLETDRTLGGIGRRHPVALRFDAEIGHEIVGKAQFDPGAHESGIAFSRAAEEVDGFLDIGAVDPREFCRPEQVKLVGRECAGCSQACGCARGFLDQSGAAAETVGYLFGDFGLNGEQVIVAAIPLFRPQNAARSRIDEVRRDPEIVAFAVDRTSPARNDIERLARIGRQADLALGRRLPACRRQVRTKEPHTAWTMLTPARPWWDTGPTLRWKFLSAGTTYLDEAGHIRGGRQSAVLVPCHLRSEVTFRCVARTFGRRRGATPALSSRRGIYRRPHAVQASRPPAPDVLQILDRRGAGAVELA